MNFPIFYTLLGSGKYVRLCEGIQIMSIPDYGPDVSYRLWIPLGR